MAVETDDLVFRVAGLIDDERRGQLVQPRFATSTPAAAACSQLSSNFRGQVGNHEF